MRLDLFEVKCQTQRHELIRQGRITKLLMSQSVIAVGSGSIHPTNANDFVKQTKTEISEYKARHIVSLTKLMLTREIDKRKCKKH